MYSLLRELNSREDCATMNYIRSHDQNRRFPSNNGNRNNNNRSSTGAITRSSRPYGSNNNANNNNNNNNVRRQQQNNPRKQCILCKASGRAFQGHDIASCWFISKFDKLEIVDAFQLNVDVDDEQLGLPVNKEVAEICYQEEFNASTSDPLHQEPDEASAVRRVSIAVSPFFYAF